MSMASGGGNKMEKRFAGKTALVAGGGAGIGKAVALRLAREGADVAAADIVPEAAEATAAEIAGLGRKSLALKLNIADIRDIAAAVDRTVAAFGGIDIFVNTAGIVQSNSFLDVSEAEWDRVIAVNQKGTAFAVQAVARRMVERVPEEVKREGRADRSYGKIVTFTSISGRRGRAYQLAYAASKAAVISITQSAALAFAPYNINVNAVSPSVVMTKMWEDNNREKERAFGIDAKKSSDEFIARIPLKRPGSLEDMAAAVAFLCSTDADYITGQTLNVDGGFEMN